MRKDRRAMVSLKLSTYQRLLAAAKDENRTMSGMIRQAIEFYLKVMYNNN